MFRSLVPRVASSFRFFGESLWFVARRRDDGIPGYLEERQRRHGPQGPSKRGSNFGYEGLAFLLAVLMLSSSCATLLAKDERTVMITSSPPGAEITINGKARGLTPTRISVDNHNRLAVTIRKEGFHPAGCYINTSIGAIWVILDLVLFATIVPLAVDLVTGDWSSLESKYCSVSLLPVN